MNIEEIMTRDVTTCTPDDSVLEAALKMKRCNCGLIPVVESSTEQNVVGVITDRDIACRVVAAGEDPGEAKVGSVMSRDTVMIYYQASFNAGLRLMAENSVRRLIVTDGTGELIGVVSLTDMARAVDPSRIGEAVQKISRQREESESYQIETRSSGGR